MISREVFVKFCAVSKDTCIAVIEKSGSQSMYSSLNKIPHEFISLSEARDYKRCVAFIRQPFTRLKSCFNHFWWLQHDNKIPQQYIPAGIIKAYGGRVKGVFGSSQYKFTEEMQEDYDNSLSMIDHLHPAATAEFIIECFNNDDYRRFIDFILLGNKDNHWDSQVELLSDEEGLVIDIAHRFEHIVDYWYDYVPGTLPWYNTWQDIPVDLSYKSEELKTLHCKDLDLYNSIDGTWRVTDAN